MPKPPWPSTRFTTKRPSCSVLPSFKAFSKAKGPEITKIDRATYDKALSELNNRVDSVISGLFQIGIHSVRINTKELAELYYNFNNPDTAVREPLVDFSKLSTMYVRKGEKQNG